MRASLVLTAVFSARTPLPYGHARFVSVADPTPNCAFPKDALGGANRTVLAKLKPGDVAMDFTLKVRHSENTVQLSSYRENRPVALVFGSYT